MISWEKASGVALRRSVELCPHGFHANSEVSVLRTGLLWAWWLLPCDVMLFDSETPAFYQQEHIVRCDPLTLDQKLDPNYGFFPIPTVSVMSLFNHGKQVHGPSSEPRLLSACVQCSFISPSPIFCALSWVRELSLPVQFSMVSHGSIFFFPCRTDFRILTKLPMSIWRLEETWTTWTPGKIAFCVLFQLLFHMPLFFLTRSCSAL